MEDFNIQNILFYPETLSIDFLEPVIQKKEVTQIPFQKIDIQSINKKNNNVFIIDKSFFLHPENTSLFSILKQESLLVLADENNHFNIPENLIYQYIHPAYPKSAFIKTVSNVFNTLDQIKKLKQTEKELIIAEDKIDELQAVGLAMSTQKDRNMLLNIIVRLCIDTTGADAGTLYLLDDNPEDQNEKILRFMVNQNFSLNIQSVPFTMPLDKKSLAGYVAITHKILNIKDSYSIPESEEFLHSKSFDEKYNYITKSILTFPMLNRKDEAIGVIQLINKRKHIDVVLKDKNDFEEFVVPFNEIDERTVSALGSQAAVALENTMLYDSIQKLFEGFIKASTKAIESRDPTTSGHSERVAFYSVELAKAVSETTSGKYKDTYFSPEQIKELEYSGLLHDFGKVGVREDVLIKAKKLYPDELQAISYRFAFARQNILIQAQNEKLATAKIENREEFEKKSLEIDQKTNESLQKLDHYLEEIKRINEPTVLKSEDFGILEEIEKISCSNECEETDKLLTPEELKKLKIPKGSLSDEERKEIESHVLHTYGFLKNIPWTSEMKNIPEIAYSHHEKINGKGYPRGISDKDILVQGKIMAIADIYDALTASDRPYKKALPVEKAIHILEMEVKDNHIDKELLDIFVQNKIYEKTRIKIEE